MKTSRDDASNAGSSGPTGPGAADQAEDFSLVLGGPLYQLYIKTRLATPGLERLRRRLLVIPSIVWMPLAVMAILEGHAFGTPSSFLRDIDVHARFLLSIPLLIVAEVVAHRRVGGLVRQFTDRGLIAPADLPRFEAIKASASRLRNSVLTEVVLIALAIGIHWLGGQQVLLSGDSWLGGRVDGQWTYTAAGVWYAFVALPIFRLMLLRWYYRTFIWYRFLWQVRGLNLRLDALHPDRAGGLGFLANSPPVFTPLLLAHSVMVAGFIQQRIWSSGAQLHDFKVEIVGSLVLSMLLVLPPLFFFVAKLAAAKREAGAKYGALASLYVSGFREKWLGGGPAPSESLVGSADIQSLADLSGAFDAVRETNLAPITRNSIVHLLMVTAIPLMPLVLNIVPFEDLLMRAVKILF